jgi:hypothetical protein
VNRSDLSIQGFTAIGEVIRARFWEVPHFVIPNLFLDLVLILSKDGFLSNTARYDF